MHIPQQNVKNFNWGFESVEILKCFFPDLRPRPILFLALGIVLNKLDI